MDREVKDEQCDGDAEHAVTERLHPTLAERSTGTRRGAFGRHACSSVRAIVSRGGRPDLAGDALPRVQAPTLLILGSLDEAVIDMSRRAARRMQCECEFSIVPGATHLFEEPGALEDVAHRAIDWFTRHLASA